MTIDTSINAPQSVSMFIRIANLVAIIIPFIGFITAVIFLWGKGFSWVEFGLLASMYVLTVLGITVGFHRLFTHKAFETNRVVQCILAILGSMAAQGPLLKWVAMHRYHHQYSDHQHDPHSPRNLSSSAGGFLRGLWYAH